MGFFPSLKSRIIIAGGGGGRDGSEDYGGAGGGIEGLSSSLGYAKGGTQTTGGNGTFKGSFGKGGGNQRFGDENSNDGNGAGGGGYFGGEASSTAWYYSGGGGSSFVSGHDGCKAIADSDDLETLVVTDQPIHYTGYRFFNTNIINGTSRMPSPNNGYEIGHCNYGAIKILHLLEISCKNGNRFYPFFLIKLFMIILISN